MPHGDQAHMSREDHKHMFANVYFKLSSDGFVSTLLQRSQVLFFYKKYSQLYVHNLKIIFEVSSQACFAMFTTICTSCFMVHRIDKRKSFALAR